MYYSFIESLMRINECHIRNVEGPIEWYSSYHIHMQYASNITYYYMANKVSNNYSMGPYTNNVAWFLDFFNPSFPIMISFIL